MRLYRNTKLQIIKGNNLKGLSDGHYKAGDISLLFGVFTPITCNSSEASVCVGDRLTPPTDWRSRQDPVCESRK